MFEFAQIEYCRTSNVTSAHASRIKRSETFCEADSGTMRELLRLSRCIEMLATEHIDSNGRRRKRDTSHYLNDVVLEIQKELEHLETSMDLDTGSNPEVHANSTQKFGVNCSIDTGGKVNCSSVIYENEKSWKKSRDQVDLLIQVLKTKIVELKDIRRHLKEHKPKNATDNDDDGGSGSGGGGDDSDEEDVSENSLSLPSTEDNNESTEKGVIVQKQSRRPHHSNNTNHTSKRPHRVHSTTATTKTTTTTTTLLTTLPTSTSTPKQRTTARTKIYSTVSLNRTHSVAPRKIQQNIQNATTPLKIQNVENAHRHHHHLHHARQSNSSHPTRRKAHDESNQDSIAIGANIKPEKRRKFDEKFDEKFDQEVDQSRAECFCEPDIER